MKTNANIYHVIINSVIIKDCGYQSPSWKKIIGVIIKIFKGEEINETFFSEKNPENWGKFYSKVCTPDTRLGTIV